MRNWGQGVLTALALPLVSVAFLLVAPMASADETITSSGPLTSIGIGSDLSCSVNYADDADGEFFGGTACGTFLDVGGPVGDGGTVYGADDLPAAGGVQSTPFTQADFQASVSGDGSAATPYTVSTQVSAGTTGLSLTQTDSYVTGADQYKTSVLIANSTASVQTVVLYHAADCYLGDDDHGYGYRDNASGGIFCTKTANNSPAGRVEGFIPVEGGSNYLEAFYANTWQAVGSGEPLADSCDCSTQEDNSMAISWTLTVPAHGSVSRSWSTDFSPVGTIQASSYVALGDSVAAGEGINENWSWTGNTWSQGQPYAWDTTSGVSNSDCHQSLSGYPHDLADELNSQLLDLACTGAGTLNGILDQQGSPNVLSQLGQQSWPNPNYDAAAPDVVTLTVGADDIDFKTKVEDCYKPLIHACGSSGDQATLDSQMRVAAHEPGLRADRDQEPRRGRRQDTRRRAHRVLLAVPQQLPDELQLHRHQPQPPLWDNPDQLGDAVPGGRRARAQQHHRLGRQPVRKCSGRPAARELRPAPLVQF